MKKILAEGVIRARDQNKVFVERNEIASFVLDHVYEDANKIRVRLGRYLSEEEAEKLCERIGHWQPSKAEK